ncbi:MAG: PilZ domain-containing protein [Magnetococcus sp. DMHC-6]
MIKKNNTPPVKTAERRHFSRIHFQHQLTLKDNKGNLYAGAFNDISLRGMLFWCDSLPPEGAELHGAFPLGEFQLFIRGIVLRTSPNFGAAIQFRDMDVESFSHLRRMIALNVGDPEKIDEEFFSSL